MAPSIPSGHNTHARQVLSPQSLLAKPTPCTISLQLWRICHSFPEGHCTGLAEKMHNSLLHTGVLGASLWTVLGAAGYTDLVHFILLDQQDRAVSTEMEVDNVEVVKVFPQSL